MQLKCSLDVGAWFDILSIFNVKILKSEGELKNKNIDNFAQLGREITEQIGKYKYDLILNSDEWYNLYEANLLTFELVDKAKQNSVDAKTVDDSNYARYLRKSELQKKFFGTEVKEVKLGY